NPPGCTTFLHSISNDDVTWYAMIIANSREDNAALAAARQGEAKPNNPPGCTISSPEYTLALPKIFRNASFPFLYFP
ncbi:hypothetical protein QMT07_09695, partial [Cronobacter sakazakii]|nr:hypothetical protein [Cronobacter sakazakii]